MMYDMLRRASVLCPGDLSTICIIWMAYLRHLVRLRWISDAYISWPLSLRPLLLPAMLCVARRAPPPTLTPPLCALGGALGLTSVGWPYWAKQSHGSTAQPRSLSALAYLELQRLHTPPGPHLVQITTNSSSFLVVCCAPAWRFVGNKPRLASFHSQLQSLSGPKYYAASRSKSRLPLAASFQVQSYPIGLAAF